MRSTVKVDGQLVSHVDHGGDGPAVIIDGGAHFLSLTDADAVDPHLRGFLDAL